MRSRRQELPNDEPVTWLYCVSALTIAILTFLEKPSKTPCYVDGSRIMAFTVKKIEAWAGDVVNEPGMLARVPEALAHAETRKKM